MVPLTVKCMQCSISVNKRHFEIIMHCLLSHFIMLVSVFRTCSPASALRSYLSLSPYCTRFSVLYMQSGQLTAYLTLPIAIPCRGLVGPVPPVRQMRSEVLRPVLSLRAFTSDALGSRLVERTHMLGLWRRVCVVPRVAEAHGRQAQ